MTFPKNSYIYSQNNEEIFFNGKGINAKVALNFYNDNNPLLKYNPQYREVQFLQKGRYEFILTLVLSVLNEADRIGIKLGSEIIKQYTIPIKKNSTIIEKFIVVIENTEEKLSVENISDDSLALVVSKGGYIMEENTLTVKTLGIPIGITGIEKINNKTITVLLNSAFIGTEVVTIYETKDPTKQYNVKVVEDSIDPDNNKRVIVNTSPVNSRFLTGVEYTIEIEREGEKVASKFTVPSMQPPVMDAQIDTIGDRILNIKFDTPLQNLDNIVPITVDPGSGPITINVLHNFYCIYYSLDANGSQSCTPYWYGFIGSDKVLTNAESTARVSEDLKSMEIQYNLRSIPIGDHNFMINFSKAQNFNSSDFIKDFTDDQKIIPTMEKPITVEKGAAAAMPTNVTALNRTNILVKFDKAVLLKLNEFNKIKLNGLSVLVKDVKRVGNTFDSLQYVLNDSTPLPPNIINITIGRITDANGYLTIEKTFNDVPVPVIRPRIIDVAQNGVAQDELIVIFSSKMKVGTDEGSALKTSYYLISKLDGTTINPVSVTSLDPILRNRFLLKTSEKLEAGMHNLIASKIRDQFELEMNAQSVPFKIIDTSIPEVLGVTTRNKSIVIKFDEAMQVDGDHATTTAANYLIDDTTTKHELPSGTTTLPMKFNRWVRIMISDSSTILPMPPAKNYKLHIGYSKLKEVRFVENVSGNIYPLCEVQNIVNSIEELDISNGTITVTTTEKLLYKYNGKNEFYNADINDFIITLNGKIIIPLATSLVNEKTIEFTFAPKTFDGGSTDIVISTKASNISSMDLYGYPIKEDVSTIPPAINALKATLIATSLVNSNANSAIIRMVFNKPIKNFEKDDFRIALNNNSTILSISTAKVISNTDNKVFEIEVPLPRALSMVDNLYILLAVPQYLIRTIDFFDNKISVFDSLDIVRFIAQSISWNKVAGSSSLANNKIIVQFNYPIHPGSLIVDSAFNGTNIPWDGSLTTVPAGTIKFSNSNNTITLLNNGTFGIINLSGTNITVSDVSNIKTASLELVDNNKVVIKFANNENALVNVSNITLVTYTPNIDVSNNTLKSGDKTLYLYAAFKPNNGPSDV